MYGCSISPNQVAYDGNDHEYLMHVAEFKNHQRINIVSNRFIWNDTKEAAFDILLDDESYGKIIGFDFFQNSYNSIGIACSCSVAFTYVCVIELGLDVIPKGEEFYDSSLNATYYSNEN